MVVECCHSEMLVRYRPLPKRERVRNPVCKQKACVIEMLWFERWSSRKRRWRDHGVRSRHGGARYQYLLGDTCSGSQCTEKHTEKKRRRTDDDTDPESHGHVEQEGWGKRELFRPACDSKAFVDEEVLCCPVPKRDASKHSDRILFHLDHHARVPTQRLSRFLFSFLDIAQH